MNIPLNIDWQQILLHWFNLAILVAGLYYLLYKPIKKFMIQRETYYRDQDEASRKHLEEAEKLETDLKERLGAVEDEIVEKKKQADSEMMQEREKELAETRKQCEKLLSDAKISGELERKRIVDGARDEVAQLAADAVDRLMSSSGTDAIDQFLEKEQGES